MEGSLWGNICGVLLYGGFMACGTALSFCVLRKEKESGAVRLLFGSVFGNVLLQWLPVPFAFLFGFGMAAQICALFTAMLGAGVLLWRRGLHKNQLLCAVKSLRRINPAAAALVGGVWLLFCVLVLHSFRLQQQGIYTGQATYGDMCMHLGFITSIARQGTFPPQYSILPGSLLCYPFLCDSISSSVYLCGASLRLSYVLPMLTAGAQVFAGFWIFSRAVLKSTGKALWAFLFFFFCGGLGFVYFLFGVDGYSLSGMMQNFYTTPTNLVDENIRWVNVVVDMLVPQRATLFGWAVLFPALYLLYRAFFMGAKKLWLPAAVLAGALPMIHTHSFVALAFICGGWVLYTLVKATYGAGGLRVARQIGKVAALCMAAFVWVLSLFCLQEQYRESAALLYALLGLAGLFIVTLLVLLAAAYRSGKDRDGLGRWGMFLAVVTALSLWQLCCWTLRQSAGSSFLRGYFNWSNQGEDYLLFCVKNVGLPLLLGVLGLLGQNGKRFFVSFPAVLLWVAAELAVFQPNTYDNNKLLYIAYALLCLNAADFIWHTVRQIRLQWLRRGLAAVLAAVCACSAVLTMAREVYSDYQLWGSEVYTLCSYVEENTQPSDVILTNQRHNNEIAALTGRNIVCGSSSYLYFHGLDFEDRLQDVYAMYEMPLLCDDLFKKYSVDYILVGSHEKATFQVDEQALQQLCTLVFDDGSNRLYRIN